MLRKIMLALVAISGLAQAHNGEVHCDSCKAWNQPQAPFKVYGNTWYVGPRGLSAVLITSPEGHILLDGALPQSAPLIERNIKALGFRVEDIKLIVNSHAHWDHAGGMAALQRDSGAVVAASAAGALTLQSGTNPTDDPQFDAKSAVHVPTIAKVKVVADGETLAVGPLRLTAHMTPGHTPGSTSWSWDSCEDRRCLAVVYADSLTPISTDGFYFSGKDGSPDISGSFAASIAKVAALKCDILLSTHPDASGTLDKLAARTPANNTFIAPDACRTYAAHYKELLDKRLAEEKAEKAKHIAK